MVKFTLNGTPIELDADPAMPLLYAIRDMAQLTGTKFGCGMGLCGACTVHLNGAAVRSCVTPLSVAEAKNITTIEGLASAGSLIAPEGSSLTAAEGSSLTAAEGSSLTAAEGSSLTAAEGSSLTAAEGSSLTAAEGSSLTAAEGSSLTAAEGSSLTAAEGSSSITDEGSLHPLQAAWIANKVPQCGYCQAGQIMSAASMLRTNAEPSDEDIETAMQGNICRCGTYPRIKKAIKEAAAVMRNEKMREEKT